MRNENRMNPKKYEVVISKLHLIRTVVETSRNTLLKKNNKNNLNWLTRTNQKSTLYLSIIATNIVG